MFVPYVELVQTRKRISMIKKIIFLCAALFQTFLFAATEGEILEKQMWMDMKDGNWTDLESRIAPEFQSVHADGARNRAEEIKLIKNLKMGDYVLSHFIVTEDKDTLIVTYLAAVQETIDQDKLGSQPTPRMSLWKNKGGTWQWIAHANFNPIQNKKK